MYSEILDVSWIKDQNAEELSEKARKNGLHNIRNGWPSHQSVFKGSCEALNVMVTPEVMRALSGFGGGIAGLGGACGALCGGIAVLGYFFGESERRDFSPLKKIIDDPSLSPYEKISISNENFKKERAPYVSLVNMFKREFGSTNCADLVSEFYPDIVSRQRFYNCHNIISKTAGFVVDTAIRKINDSLQPA
ncbi:MAG: C-GCAxxG-C-C family protein [Desulfobacterales bacterium]|nr:C-GCAxxG-C-C family protein [Desulfobacterales bacterium]